METHSTMAAAHSHQHSYTTTCKEQLNPSMLITSPSSSLHNHLPNSSHQSNTTIPPCLTNSQNHHHGFTLNPIPIHHHNPWQNPNSSRPLHHSPIN
jgi:hypothetical protein